MGPSIIFDKSALQSLGQQAIYEVSRYFYTVIPTVLLYEILADLSLDADDLDASKKRVAEVSRKVLPIDSMTNIHYHTLCVGNLLGNEVEMKRRPLVGGAKTVVSSDGRQGVFVDVQPENQAVLRWQRGEFSDNDLKFARQWRDQLEKAGLEQARQKLPKPDFKLDSLMELNSFVGMLLSRADSRFAMLNWFLDLLGCQEGTREQVRQRWQDESHTSIKEFAPYAFHCLRIQTLFYLGMSHGIFGIRSSNVVDVEYLCYTPFAYVFCSGDKLHQKMAPLVLENDQSFITRDEMQQALQILVAARKESGEAEPGDDSLIRKLRIKHGGRFRPSSSSPAVSEERLKTIRKEIKSMIEAMEEQSRKAPPPRRFPS